MTPVDDTASLFAGLDRLTERDLGEKERVGQLVDCLRALGEELLKDVLEPIAKGSRSQHRPPFFELLGARYAQLFGELESGSTRPPGKYSDTVVSTIQCAKPLTWWDGQAALVIRRLVGLDRGYNVPERLWPQLGESAWGSLSFRRRVSELMEATLRQRVLFVLEGKIELPEFALDVRTLWLLIALGAAAVDRGLLDGFRSDRVRVHNAVSKLGAIGLRLGLAARWAGVWDQWVLLEAARSWPSDRRPAELTLAIELLPLLRLQQASAAPGAAVIRPALGKDAVELACDGWVQQIPAWFGAWWSVQYSGANY